jgi:hypothetical protein
VRQTGWHHPCDRAFFQAFDHLLSLFLRHIAVQRGGRVTPGLQPFGQLRGGYLGAHKHEQGVEGLYLEDAGQRIQLVQATDQPIALADSGGGGGAGLDGNLLRVIQMASRNALDFFRHGRREQRHLTLLRQLLQHPLDVVDETHAQHLIRLIQYQRLQGIQPERALAHVVHYPARGTDNHMHAAFQLPYLPRVILAAIDRQHVKTLYVGGITMKGLSHLDRQLAGWREYHHLYLLAADVETRYQGQGKGGGLASTGGGVSQQVQPLQQVGDGLGLDRGGGFVANLIEHGQ